MRSLISLTVAVAFAVIGNPSLADPTLEELRAVLGSDGEEESLLFLPQSQRRVAFAHIEALYPTRRLAASAAPYPLRDNPADLHDVHYVLDGEEYSLGSFLQRPEAVGLLVVSNDEVLLEHYAPGNDRNTRWISFSVTKSVTSLLIGAAIADGFIQSVDEPVAHYLPRLRGTPYEQATIRHVLQMASGVAWNEDYDDPESDAARAGAANGLELVRYLSALPREHAAGEVFNYNTGETNLAGEILRAAIGNNASSYLSQKIWQPFGMESDAHWLTTGGSLGETGGCCINATLRDYARIGLFALHEGRLRDGTQVLPEGWMQASTTPSPGNDGYGYLWWLKDEGAFEASGIFGQKILVDPAQNLVIAAHSNAPSATGSDYAEHLDAVLQALRAGSRSGFGGSGFGVRSGTRSGT